MSARQREATVAISAGDVTLEGALELPAQPAGVVVFSHGSGSGRFSPRNQFVAAELHKLALGTVLLDLLTETEDRDYERRFDIDLLTQRLGHAVRFVRSHAATKTLPVGLFGASTGAASALRVAAAMPKDVGAVVSRGGRPDLAGAGALGQVRADSAHRRRTRFRGHRAQRVGARCARAQRAGTGNRSRRDASVRGARHAG
jgi:pimeloyl-ACP methyl ester carboxylesterase